MIDQVKYRTHCEDIGLVVENLIVMYVEVILVCLVIALEFVSPNRVTGTLSSLCSGRVSRCCVNIASHSASRSFEF